MNTVITPSVGRAVETVETVMIENRAPTSIKTTLYDLIVAIQDAVEPGRRDSGGFHCGTPAVFRTSHLSRRHFGPQPDCTA